MKNYNEPVIFYKLLLILFAFSLFFSFKENKDEKKIYDKVLREKDSVIYCRDSSLAVWMNSFERVKKICKEEINKKNK